MATIHRLSVLTNSSIKRPINPKTGHTASLKETPPLLKGLLSDIYGDEYNDLGQSDPAILDANSTIINKSFPFKFESSTTTEDILNLMKLSDNEFYQKLIELKNEQRKILKSCEKIYISKHKGVVAATFADEADIEDEGNEHHSECSLGYTCHYETLINNNDNLRKQPPPAYCKDDILFQYDGFRQRKSNPNSVNNSLSGRHNMLFGAGTQTLTPSHSKSAPVQKHITRSLEDLGNSVIVVSQPYRHDHYVLDDTVSEPCSRRHKQYSLLENMWNHFSIEDFVPRNISERPSSARVTHKEKKIQDDSWRHRLTIPQPFSMTIREENINKKKFKNRIKFEQMMLQKQLDEVEECKNKFRATPVPAHVYLPLVDVIQDHSEAKRRHIKHMSAEVLKSLEKPFSFTKREENQKLHHKVNKDCTQSKSMQDTQNKTPISFKAKPIPKCIFDTTLNDKMLEEDEYRKIRNKIRAEKLLSLAALPPNMNARQQMKEQKAREELMNSQRNKKKDIALRQRIIKDVPNYDVLYKKFQEELQKRKVKRQKTVVEPFRLATERSRKTVQEKMKTETENKDTTKENRWPCGGSLREKVKLGPVCKSLECLPYKSTKSADIRSRQTRNYLRQLVERELHEIDESRQSRAKELKLKHKILQKIKLLETQCHTADPGERKKRFREADHVRMEEYQHELQEITERVSKRPMLFEQESQGKAKKKMENKLKATHGEMAV